MHTLGSTFVPPGFHAGGLRYHGMAPLVSHLHDLGLIEARAYHQTAVFEAGVQLRARGGHPARAGGEPRRQGGDRRGRPLPGGGPVGDDPLQPLRARSLRHAGLHRLLRRASSRTATYDEGELAMALAGPARRRRLGRPRVARQPEAGRELAERGHGVVLGPRGEHDGAVLGPASAPTSSSTPAASANALCACAPPNGTSSSGSAAPESTSPCVTAPIETSATNGTPSEDGTAIAIGFVPVSGAPPVGMREAPRRRRRHHRHETAPGEPSCPRAEDARREARLADDEPRPLGRVGGQRRRRRRASVR